MRAAIKKGLLEWINFSNPDIICLQEVKAELDQLPLDDFKNLGYEFHLHPAERKGYSGVGILSKKKPKNVVLGCGISKIDKEGRIIRADFDEFSILSTYLPSGTSPMRQEFKLEFLVDFDRYIVELLKEFPRLIIAGDFNICHTKIDIHNPIRHVNTPGFTIEERKWMSAFLNGKFIDSFRNFNQEPNHYTWWSYRANARNKNLGWRIDYQLISFQLQQYLNAAGILKRAEHSDHCPTQVILDV